MTQDDQKKPLEQKKTFAPIRGATPPFYIRFLAPPGPPKVRTDGKKIFFYIPGSLGYLVSSVDGYKSTPVLFYIIFNEGYLWVLLTFFRRF